MNFKKFLFLFILAFFIGFGVFYFISQAVNIATAPTPWIMITLLLFPASYCVQALFKLPESNEHPSLSSSELRRLTPIIRLKSRRLSALAIYYLISALVIALGYYAIPTSLYYYSYFVSISGGLIASSLFSFLFIKSIMDELQSFKSKLIHRTESEKTRKDIVEKANKKAD